MKDFASQCGQTCENYSEVWGNYFRTIEYLEYGDPAYDEAGDIARVQERWREITYDDCIRIGFKYLKNGEVFTQLGSESARDLLWREGMIEQFWKHWSVLTREKIEEDITQRDDWQRGNPFSCSC